MKKILLLSPGIASLNRGDEIISEGVINNLSNILKNQFVTKVSTHTPLNLAYIKHLKDYDYKFVCGSNLLMGKMNGLFRQWDIKPISSFAVKDCILVGVGWWQPDDKPNLYTRWLYKRILSKKYIHSVRDEYTKKMLESIGIKNVINTGCATMWDFTPEFCKLIPTKKNNEVIFTLTDYMKDIDKDKKLINILIKNYKKVYFWPQGEKDYDYIINLGFEKKVEIIDNTLNGYNEFLQHHNCDYIGTRLHGGIRALQMKKRTMIISVDNRAREKKKDFNIPCIERNEIEKIEDKFINIDYVTDIKIPNENIKKWKNQFKDI